MNSVLINSISILILDIALGFELSILWKLEKRIQELERKILFKKTKEK